MYISNGIANALIAITGSLSMNGDRNAINKGKLRITSVQPTTKASTSFRIIQLPDNLFSTSLTCFTLTNNINLSPSLKNKSGFALMILSDPESE